MARVTSSLRLGLTRACVAQGLRASFVATLQISVIVLIWLEAADRHAQSLGRVPLMRQTAVWWQG